MGTRTPTHATRRPPTIAEARPRIRPRITPLTLRARAEWSTATSLAQLKVPRLPAPPLATSSRRRYRRSKLLTVCVRLRAPQRRGGHRINASTPPSLRGTIVRRRLALGRLRSSWHRRRIPLYGGVASTRGDGSVKKCFVAGVRRVRHVFAMLTILARHCCYLFKTPINVGERMNHLTWPFLQSHEFANDRL
jgi:hypothetical protein